MEPNAGTRHSTTAVVLLGVAAALALAVQGCEFDDEAVLPTTPRRARGDAGSGDGGALSDDASAGARRGGPEVCNNGFDDDGNGQIDEGCVCVPGATQRCFAGSSATAGVGACAWGTQQCAGDGEFGDWGACEGAGAASAEVCDTIDNNCDGMVDEGCSCTVGMTRDCYLGPDHTAGVGACRRGTQRCAMSGADATWGACAGSVTPVPEVCGDAVDNDCDGMVDEGCVCPAGQTPTYHTSASAGSSGVIDSGGPLYTMSCEPGTPCPMGQVRVYTSPLSSGREGLPGAMTPGDGSCVPPPPMCPPGQQFDLVGGSWRCVPCAVQVQYGGIYGFQRVCADRPMDMCPPGESPTFVYETRSWQCRATCDNGQYDQVYLRGMLVCVPC